jgi:hypothetical protein
MRVPTVATTIADITKKVWRAKASDPAARLRATNIKTYIGPTATAKTNRKRKTTKAKMVMSINERPPYS